jgi:hypothetical protein
VPAPRGRRPDWFHELLAQHLGQRAAPDVERAEGEHVIRVAEERRLQGAPRPAQVGRPRDGQQPRTRGGRARCGRCLESAAATGASVCQCQRWYQCQCCQCRGR